MEIPFNLHAGLALNKKTYLNLAVGLQMNITSNPDLSLDTLLGNIQYSGEFSFIDNQQTYLLNDIPELGFESKKASLSDNKIDIADITYGLRGSLSYGRRLSASMPVYLEIGPQFYYGLNELFETNPTDSGLIGDKGEVGNVFQQLTNGKNYMGAFFVGIRYFFR